MDIDFGELKNDLSFVNKVTTATEAIAKIEKSIIEACQITNFDELSADDKAKYDLYLIYATNSLYWMYLKLNGNDPNAHGIKTELNRIKEAMMRKKDIYDNKHNRPVLQTDAAKRMVRGGLYDHKQKNEDFKKRYQNNKTWNKNQQGNKQQFQNRKRKFTDNE
ncbi:unnamed protein product [Diamesa tonsa]